MGEVTVKIEDMITLLCLINRARWQRDWQATEEEKMAFGHACQALDTQYHVQLATFKQEHNLAGGWHIERGAPPKPLGGWWLRWYFDSSKWGNVGMDIVKAG